MIPARSRRIRPRFLHEGDDRSFWRLQRNSEIADPGMVDSITGRIRTAAATAAADIEIEIRDQAEEIADSDQDIHAVRIGVRNRDGRSGIVKLLGRGAAARHIQQKVDRPEVEGAVLQCEPGRHGSAACTCWCKSKTARHGGPASGQNPVRLWGAGKRYTAVRLERSDKI